MSLRLPLLAALGALAVAATPAAAAVDFSSLVGQNTPLSLSLGGGLTATFSAPSDPGAFSAQTTAGLFSFNTGLVDNNSFPGDTLNVAFSRPISAVSFTFGVEDFFPVPGADSLAITSSAGQTATFAASPTALTLSEPEGFASFTGAQFTSLTISSPGANGLNAFALGAVAVPEPMSLSLLGVGLVGLRLSRRRS